MKVKKGIALVMANAEYVQQNKLLACKKDGEDVKEALEYLNLLRSKRISDYTPYVMGNLPAVDELALVRVNAEGGAFTPLLWAIHCERRKELFMEGDRWFDLKRNGCPEFWIAKDGLKYETKQFMYTAPIPSRDIDLIPGMIQNEGYV